MTLTIVLSYNLGLNESNFHADSGLDKVGRPIYLDLHNCQFSSLPKMTFEPILDAHPSTSLYLMGNPLVCDERVGWLKQRRVDFESRVRGANCVNDPGQTVFNSTLVPLPSISS